MMPRRNKWECRIQPGLSVPTVRSEAPPARRTRIPESAAAGSFGTRAKCNSVRQDAYVRLVELSRAMNHVFIREAGGVGDNPGHSKSSGRAAHCQVASDSVRQR